ncbi:hypothetical protein DPMN_022863 [Dreissena polymorpha]|uniref:Uncharacterized protein n=1 Tax=Dreissena polymorpha TaxID=45954 RepID=A0A9D4NPA2_DREPO|nr:hypothetical protein DPMN_022863 [Dreissena polymorpha]
MASNRQHSYPSYIKPPKTDGCKPPRRPPNLSTNQKADLTPFQPIRTLEIHQAILLLQLLLGRDNDAEDKVKETLFSMKSAKALTRYGSGQTGGRTERRTDGRTDRQRQNSIPPPMAGDNKKYRISY